jgi:Fe-S cluster biogenesis protein NfuA/nitrite reductase/ring-hydroxylating ferredoxin subunit
MSNNNGSGLPALDDLNQEGKRIHELVERIGTLPDSAAREMLQECLESVLSFYGKGLARILHLVEKAGDDGKKIREALLNDSGVTGLLLIHGLHPVSMETRLRNALEKVRPYMKSHGGDVELLSLENEFARLRLEGHCKTCPSSTVTLELAVRSAIEEACPDLAGFDVEGIPKTGAPGDSFEHLPHAAPEWKKIELPPLNENELSTVHLGTEPLVVCRVGEELYAYYDRCPACNMPLHMGRVEREILTCHLGHRYDVQRAGAGLDENHLHLDPLPLLAQNGEVKVALTHSTAGRPSAELISS